LLRVVTIAWVAIFCWSTIARDGRSVGREKLYWSDRVANTIRRANLDGSQVETLVDGMDEVRGVAVDWQRHMLYWADNGANKIQRSLLDGSHVEDLVTQGLGFPAGIALDVAGNKMYWADAQASRIQRANLDGSGVEDVVTGLSNPYFVTVDSQNGHLYWSDYGTDKIQRADLDGSNLIDLISTGLSLPRGVDIDLQHGKLYWADRQTDLVQRSNLDGSSIEDLHLATPSHAAPHGVAVDPFRQHVYWVDNGLVTVKRMDSDGGNVVELFGADSGVLQAPWQVVLDLRTTVPGCAGGQPCSPGTEEQRIDQISTAILTGAHVAEHDYNRDGQTTAADRDFLLSYVLNTVTGDANLNGHFNSSDLVQVLQAGFYEDSFPGNAGWGTGDWNGDREFDTADLVLALQVGGYEVDTLPVPEPRTVTLVIWAACILLRRPVAEKAEEPLSRRSP
jgi:DNA-binding beta-propeller fold protein YncE